MDEYGTTPGEDGQTGGRRQKVSIGSFCLIGLIIILIVITQFHYQVYNNGVQLVYIFKADCTKGFTDEDKNNNLYEKIIEAFLYGLPNRV